MNRSEKFKRAETTKIGDTWKNIKTERIATVLENNHIRGVYLKHETGKEGYIQQYNLAKNYIQKETL